MYNYDINAHGYDQHCSDSDEPFTFDHEEMTLMTSSSTRNRTTNQARRRRRINASTRASLSASASYPARNQHTPPRTRTDSNWYEQDLPHFANRNLQRTKHTKAAASFSLSPKHRKNNKINNSNNKSPRGLRTRNRTGRWHLFQIIIFGAALVTAIVYGALYVIIAQQGQDQMDGIGIDKHTHDLIKESFLKPHIFHNDLSLPHDLATPIKSQAASKVLDAVLSGERLSLDQSQARMEERQRRTRPNSFALDASSIELYNSSVKPYSFQFLNNVAQGHNKSLTNEKESGHGHGHVHGHGHRHSTRCGIDAQTAFAANPLTYPDIHAISNKSVVLIIGILGQLGFHLALKLATECNVQVMIGVDPMFPNESKYSLQLLEQISILYTEVPDLKKPLMTSFQGVNPRKNSNSLEFFNSTTGDFDIGAYAAPTHVVHVVSDDTYSFHDGRDSDDSDSPYSSNDGLFAMRQSLVATEQLLSKLGESQPLQNLHFTFISDPGVLRDNSDDDKKQGIYTVTKMMQEILIQSYSQRLGGHSFVTLRIPKVYGPWGKPGSFDYDLARKAVMHWHDKDTMERSSKSDESALLQLSGHTVQSKIEHDILFVDDAVDAIVAAMQYKPTDLKVATFNIVSGEKASPSTVADILEGFMPIHTHIKATPHLDSIHNKDGAYIYPELALTAKKELNWAPKNFLRDGVKILIAWHLDNHLPFGPPAHATTDTIDNDSILDATETGSRFLLREGNPLCRTDDLYCLRGRNVLPCSSECSDSSFCTISPLDRVQDASRLLTEKCELVLYTAFLTDDTSDLGVSAPPDDGESSICNAAFILSSSPLAISLLQNLTNGTDQGVKSGILLYKGWNVIPISSAEIDISLEVSHILKLSPGKFFHQSVKSAIYIPPDFQTAPEIEDVKFMTGLLHRPKTMIFGQRVYHSMEKMRYMVGQTERDALIVVPGAVSSGTGSNIPSYNEVKAAVEGESMRDYGTQCHFKFEEQINKFFKSRDFEANTVDSYPFVHRQHWITNKHWVVHDLAKLEAKNIRCEWYREQAKWEDANDSFSFAHIMARMEVERFNSLFDDEAKAVMLEELKVKEINMETDEYGWHIVEDRYSNENGYVRILDESSLMNERNLWDLRK